MLWACLGRECKLGWGWNLYLEKLIPVERELANVVSKNADGWGYSVYHLSSTEILYWDSTSLLLEPKYKKLLDFRIIFDNNQYWQVRCCVIRRTEKYEELSKYPPNCSHFVKMIYHGADLWVQFLKIGPAEKDKDIVNLFEKRNPDESRKKLKCRVLVNYSEIIEMTMEELMNFMAELSKGKHTQYDIPVYFGHQELDQKIPETVISNEGEFVTFLSHVYCAYRKIEMKMKMAGYSDVLLHLDFDGKSFIDISSNLDKVKENYRSMDRTDFLKIYPVLKKFFLCYIDYITYSIKNAHDMYEGDYLPGSVEEIKCWLQKLNTWVPDRINMKKINWMSCFIVTPSGHEEVIETLQKTGKLINSKVITDDTAMEPYIEDEDNKKILFGFVNMEGAVKKDIPCNPVVLESECPQKCTQDIRKWICTKCGEYIKIKRKFIGKLLVCSCGSKKYKDKLLTCHSPSHREQLSLESQY